MPLHGIWPCRPAIVLAGYADVSSQLTWPILTYDRGDVLRSGSAANNDKGGFEVYRASKSALNQLMRSFAARNADDRTRC